MGNCSTSRTRTSIEMDCWALPESPSSTRHFTAFHVFHLDKRKGTVVMRFWDEDTAFKCEVYRRCIDYSSVSERGKKSSRQSTSKSSSMSVQERLFALGKSFPNEPRVKCRVEFTLELLIAMSHSSSSSFILREYGLANWKWVRVFFGGLPLPRFAGRNWGLDCTAGLLPICEKHFEGVKSGSSLITKLGCSTGGGPSGRGCLRGRPLPLFTGEAEKAGGWKIGLRCVWGTLTGNWLELTTWEVVVVVVGIAAEMGLLT